MNPEDDFLLGPMGTPSAVGQISGDFARGLKFSPFDLLGAPVDLVNMGLQGVDAMFGRRNVLGSERPLLGADDLINRYADFVDYLGYDYGRPTGSLAETAGRVTGGILAPTGGAATLGRGVDLLEAGGRAYAAGAPARVAERARTTTLGSGIDPTAPIDDMIVRRMGDNGGPPMTPEVPARDIDELGFVSQALETARGLQQPKGSGEQYRSMLLKGGVKPDEIAFTPGLEGLLSQPRVTRDELVGLLQQNRISLDEYITTGDEFQNSAMNFPATADVLDMDVAYGPDFIEDEVDMILDTDADAVLSQLEARNPGEYVDADGDQKLQVIKQAIEQNLFEELPGYVQDEVRDIAKEFAIERYSYDPVLRLQDPDTGYEIVGTDDMGYSIRNEAGEFVDTGNNTPFSLSEARIQAETDAIDRGIVGYSGGDTRYAEYTEDGGTNYQEIRLTAPVFEGRGDFFQGDHFEEPNIVVHLRTTDRTMAKDAGDVLYVEELQSDWGQQGRGMFIKPGDREALPDLMKKSDDYFKTLAGIHSEEAKAHAEMMKRLQKEIGGEYEYYKGSSDLYENVGGQRVSKVSNEELMMEMRRAKDGVLRIAGAEIEAKDLLDKYAALQDRYYKVDEEHMKVLEDINRIKRGFDPAPFVGSSKKFAEVAIKRLLAKAVQEDKKYVSFSPGEVQYDRWNEEGLETFYDNIIPKAAAGVVKKLDPEATVGNMQVRMTGPADKASRLTIEITPKMREAVKKGIPLFSAGGAGLLGVGMQGEPQPAGGIL